MAILDVSKNQFIDDKDENVFIGLKLPLALSTGPEGYFESHPTTISAVKENIKNLLRTRRGERLMQPTLGIGLDEFLFEQIDADLQLKIEARIKDTLSFWMPFVEISKLKINIDSEGPDDVQLKNNINIRIIFNIKNNSNLLDSVEVTV